MNEKTVEEIMQYLDEHQYFKQITPAYFGCEFLHERTLYQALLRHQLKQLLRDFRGFE